jgi:hypothetical protein
MLQFEVTRSSSDICSIDMLNDVDKKTSMVACSQLLAARGGFRRLSAQSKMLHSNLATKKAILTKCLTIHLSSSYGARFNSRPFIHMQKWNSQTNIKDATIF